MGEVIKLSSPATQEFWEIPILFEDADYLAIAKPSCLLTSPDRYDPARPNLMKLLHREIERGAKWARSRNLSYLMNAHRLDFETSGVLLLTKSKPALVFAANLFGSEKPLKTYVALARGGMLQDEFEIKARIGPHPIKVGLMRVDEKNGKVSRTLFTVRERFKGLLLLECRPVTGRTHQIRVHLQYLGLPIAGDKIYGGHALLLSQLKGDYRLKPDRVERPLISTVALHAEKLQVLTPSGTLAVMEAPWPKDLAVAVKYLRRYAS